MNIKSICFYGYGNDQGCKRRTKGYISAFAFLLVGAAMNILMYSEEAKGRHVNEKFKEGFQVFTYLLIGIGLFVGCIQVAMDIGTCYMGNPNESETVKLVPEKSANQLEEGRGDEAAMDMQL